MIFVVIAIILIGTFAIYKSTQAVVDLSERRSGFVSAVTHELKTPLSNIRLYIEMLEQGIASTPEREQEYYRILGSESSRLSRLINNVLEFSKLEKKQRSLNLQHGTFEEVIKDFTDILKEKLQLEGFNLRIEKGNLKPFNYDREAMIQILINLVENSIKFGRTSEKKEVVISIKNEKKYTTISIADTGPGIPGHALKKIFEDFYRVDNSLTRKTGGTGIGLALVKNFVTEMGGTVSASNNNGPGCTITLHFPAA
jgi:signal transduction histidine kinase